MPIIKVNVYSVKAERNLEAKGGQIDLNNNVGLKDVQDMDFNQNGQKGLKFQFEFDCKYEPGLGTVEVKGQVFYVEEAKLIKEIKESWDKDKRVPTAVMEEVIDAALHKGNIQAVKIADEVGLPSPLPLPKVARGGKKEKK